MLDNDIDRPAEFPDKTFDACSLPRILRLIGWFQLLSNRLARVRGTNASNDNLRITPSRVSGISKKDLIYANFQPISISLTMHDRFHDINLQLKNMPL